MQPVDDALSLGRARCLQPGGIVGELCLVDAGCAADGGKSNCFLIYFVIFFAFLLAHIKFIMYLCTVISKQDF